VTRRDALATLSAVAAGFWALAAASLSFLFLGSTLRIRSMPEDVVAGDASIVRDEFQAVRLRIPIQDGWETRTENRVVFVKANADDPSHPFVLSVRWDEESGEFQCPCHGGRFNADGDVIGGPPPRGLSRMRAEMRGGDLRIGLDT